MSAALKTPEGRDAKALTRSAISPRLRSACIEPCTTQQDYAQLGLLLSEAQAVYKKIKEGAAKILAPLNAARAEVHEQRRDALDPLEEQIAAIKYAMIVWNELQQSKLLKEADKKAKRLERQGALEVAADVRTIAAATKAVPKISTASVTSRWDFEVEDELQVPSAVVLRDGSHANLRPVDPRGVRQAIRDGVREIPGIKIFQRTGISGKG